MRNVLNENGDKELAIRGHVILTLESMRGLVTKKRAWNRYVLRVQRLLSILLMDMGLALVIRVSSGLQHPAWYAFFSGVFIAVGIMLLITKNPVELVNWMLLTIAGEDEECEELEDEVCAGCEYLVPYGIYIVFRCGEYHVFTRENDTVSSQFQSRHLQRAMEFGKALLM